jgi:hypothetical protein
MNMGCSVGVAVGVTVGVEVGGRNGVVLAVSVGEIVFATAGRRRVSVMGGTSGSESAAGTATLQALRRIAMIANKMVVFFI